MTAGPPSRWRVDFSLVAISIIWGSTFVLVKQALDDISTLLFLTLRFTIAVAALAIILRKGLRGQALFGASVRGGLVAGLCLFSGYVLQTFGLKYTTPAKAGFLTGLYIPLVPLFSLAINRKTPLISELLGIAAAALGMALMTVQDGSMSIGIGDLLVIACAVAYAFHILALGRFAKSSSVAVLTITQIGVCAALGGISFWWAERPQIRWSASVWLALSITSLLATALVFYLQTWAQQYSSPSRTALIFSLEPVFAWLASFLITGEILSRRGVFGAAFILFGILLVELKPLTIKQHQ